MLQKKAQVVPAFICPDCQAPSVVKELPVRDDGKPFYNYAFHCKECDAEKCSRYDDIQILLEVEKF